MYGLFRLKILPPRKEAYEYVHPLFEGLSLLASINYAMSANYIQTVLFIQYYITITTVKQDLKA